MLRAGTYDRSDEFNLVGETQAMPRLTRIIGTVLLDTVVQRWPERQSENEYGSQSKQRREGPGREDRSLTCTCWCPHRYHP